MANALEAASLVMIPSGYEDGTLGSLKPTDGSGDFTFSRGSNLSATRINEQGYIEKGYENLLEQSNSFLTTWSQVGSFNILGSQQGYDSSNNAWSIESNNTAFDRRIQQSLSLSGVHTFSVYAKSNSTDWILFYNGTDRVYFDLANGVVGSSQSGLIIDSKIEPTSVTGWYRCTATFNRGISFISVVPASGDGNSNVLAGNSIYIQDAMLNQGLVAYPYIETTTAPVAGGILEDEPRIDFSDGCGHLLLEPKRTNLITHSEYFEGSGWVVLNGITLDANNTTSPEGITNAYEVTATSINHNIYLDKAVSISTDYTLSFYAKRGTMTDMKYAIYDSTNGSFIVSETSYYSRTSNEWSRISVNFTTPLNCFAIRIFPLRNSGVTGNVYLWGAQLEQDATYPTSYIPTYGVSQTRLADDATTDITSLIDTSGSVAYFEGTIQDLTGATESFRDVFALTGAGGISLRIERRITNQYYIQRSSATINSGDDFNSYSDASMNDNTIKIAFKFSSTQLKLFYNGSLMQTFDGSYNFGFTNFKFRDGTTGNNITNKNNKVLIFDTALSDDECIALTTI